MMNDDFNYDNNFWDITTSSIENRLDAGILSSWQAQTFGSAGDRSVLNQNEGKNFYAYRDTKIHLDDWVFFDDDAAMDAQARQILEDYRKDTKQYWRNEGIGADSTFMTTNTLSADDMNMDKLWKKFYPSRISYKKITELKQDVDPCNIFGSGFTVPLKNQSNKRHCTTA